MTYKQKIAASKVVENGGNIGKAMLAAGYSPATAKTPQKLTRSKGWQKLFKQHLPEEKLLEKHKQLLDASTLETFEVQGTADDETMREIFKEVPTLKVIKVGWPNGLYESPTIVHFSSPDYRTQLEALKLAYKLKGKLNSNVSVSGEKVIAILNGANTHDNADSTP